MPEWTTYLTAGKTALDILKSVRELLPKGEESEEAGRKLDEAERSLKLSEAELAKNLGFRICRCAFPPNIMLWNERERAHFCAACGHRYPPKASEVGTLMTPGPWSSARRG
jgi:hypothetical protein